MKSLTLALLAALTAVSFAADTPEDILKDYRSKTETPLAKLNETLEKSLVPIIVDLVKTGDTKSSDLISAQLRAKKAGEPVVQPHARVSALFTSYDAARKRIVDPARQAATARIDSMLKSADGKRLEVVEELAQVREQIFSSKSSSWVQLWSLRTTPDSPPNGTLLLNEDGSSVFTSKVGNKTAGTWKVASNKANTIEVTFPTDKWLATMRKSGIELKTTQWPNLRCLVPAN